MLFSLQAAVPIIFARIHGELVNGQIMNARVFVHWLSAILHVCLFFTLALYILPVEQFCWDNFSFGTSQRAAAGVSEVYDRSLDQWGGYRPELFFNRWYGMVIFMLSQLFGLIAGWSIAKWK